MKYLETQLNEFQQKIGLLLESFSPIEFQIKDLHGAYVSLSVLDDTVLPTSSMEQLWSVIEKEPDERCWTYLPYDGPRHINELADMLQQHFSLNPSIHFLVKVDQQIVGWIALLNQRAQSRVIEIGNVYFSSILKQRRSATEVVYLLLKACFEQSFRRVEWKCDALNEPSQAAAKRFGFQYEGLFRQDRIVKGRTRNTMWFSIIDEEWPLLEKAYTAWLAADNFDQYGQQKIRLQDFMQLYRT